MTTFKITEISQGEMFGEDSIITQRVERNFNAVTVTDCILLKVAIDCLASHVSKCVELNRLITRKVKERLYHRNMLLKKKNITKNLLTDLVDSINLKGVNGKERSFLARSFENKATMQLECIRGNLHKKKLKKLDKKIGNLKSRGKSRNASKRGYRATRKYQLTEKDYLKKSEGKLFEKNSKSHDDERASNVKKFEHKVSRVPVGMKVQYNYERKGLNKLMIENPNILLGKPNRKKIQSDIGYEAKYGKFESSIDSVVLFDKNTIKDLDRRKNNKFNTRKKYLEYLKKMKIFDPYKIIKKKRRNHSVTTSPLKRRSSQEMLIERVVERCFNSTEKDKFRLKNFKEKSLFLISPNKSFELAKNDERILTSVYIEGEPGKFKIQNIGFLTNLENVNISGIDNSLRTSKRNLAINTKRTRSYNETRRREYSMNSYNPSTKRRQRRVKTNQESRRHHWKIENENSTNREKSRLNKTCDLPNRNSINSIMKTERLSQPDIKQDKVEKRDQVFIQENSCFNGILSRKDIRSQADWKSRQSLGGASNKKVQILNQVKKKNFRDYVNLNDPAAKVWSRRLNQSRNRPMIRSKHNLFRLAPKKFVNYKNNFT